MERLGFSWVIEGEVAGCQGPRSASDLLFLHKLGIRALIRMADGSAADALGKPAAELGFRDHHEPVPDFTAPSAEQCDGMVAFIREAVYAGMPVAVSCGAGLGRTGTILACYLVSKGLKAQEAIREVGRTRPGSIETPEQKQAVFDFEPRHGATPRNL